MNETTQIQKLKNKNFGFINFVAKKKLNITLTEYFFLFLVNGWTYNAENKTGWCYASKETLAERLDIHFTYVYDLIKKFTELEYTTKDGKKFVLLEKNSLTKYLRTTPMWEKITELEEGNSVELQPSLETQKVSQKATGKARHDATSDNADDNVSPKPQEEKNLYHTNELIGFFKEINPIRYEDFYKIKAYRDAVEKTEDFLGYEGIKQYYQALPQINSQPMTTKSTTPIEALNNLAKYNFKYQEKKNSKGSYMSEEQLMNT